MKRVPNGTVAYQSKSNVLSVIDSTCKTIYTMPVHGVRTRDDVTKLLLLTFGDYSIDECDCLYEELVNSRHEESAAVKNDYSPAETKKQGLVYSVQDTVRLYPIPGSPLHDDCVRLLATYGEYWYVYAASQRGAAWLMKSHTDTPRKKGIRKNIIEIITVLKTGDTRFGVEEVFPVTTDWRKFIQRKNKYADNE